MCLLLRMGNCSCFTPNPNPESSSANLTESSFNKSNHPESYDKSIKSSSTNPPNNKIKPNDIITDINLSNNIMNTKSDIFPINEETQEQTNDNIPKLSPNSTNNIPKLSHNINTNNNRLRPHSNIKNNNAFQQLEQSQSITNMTTPTVNSSIAATPSNINTTTPVDDMEYYTQHRLRHTSIDENEPIDNTIIESDKNTYNNNIYKNLELQQNQTSINAFISKIKSKTNRTSINDNTNEEPKYHKAPSTETQSSTTGIDIIFIDESKKEDQEEEEEDSDSPGPLPTLKLFNNSNRPPVWGKKRTASIDSSNDKYSINNININEIQYAEITKTHTPTLSSRVDTIDRLKIPALTPLNKSVSAFDELGKKLNRLPSFHRALTNSITSLT
eukprot:736544_1